MRTPLFLLHSVLFPGASLALKVFEARYLDMVSACLRDAKPFGVCLIKSGHEVGDAGEPHRVGTLARIEQWEMQTPGVLQILVRGTGRFSIQAQERHGQLVVADVEPWAPEPELAIPERYATMVEFLQDVLAREARAPGPEPRLEDASWVGMRLAALLPVDNRLKQEWLVMRDPVIRLAAIMVALEELARNAH